MLRHQPVRSHADSPFLAAFAPLALRVPGREFQVAALLIASLGLAVHPAVTQRVLDRVVPMHARRFACFVVDDQPDDLFLLAIAFQPVPPCTGTVHLERGG